ncbi:MAG: BamA/TamA family outer membrane protein [Sulfurovum sp.]|nr:BamA/TamA family outer membrane protein [Sulfurovum sp.]
MKKKKHIFISIFAAVLLSGQPLCAGGDLDDANITAQTPQEPTSKDMVWLPYLFSTDSTGLAGGVGVIKQGFLQPQTTTITTLFYGADQDIITNGQPDTSNFSGGFAAIFDYLIPGTDRLLFSAMGMKSNFPKSRYYIYDHTNDSSDDKYTESSGNVDFVYLTLKYVLPLGDGLDNPEGHYILRNGFAVGRESYGGGTPFVTGRTSLGLTGFYEHNTFDNYIPNTDPTRIDRSSRGLQDWNTNGLRFFIDHDNTDFDLNPSRGYQFRLRYSRDFGWGNSTDSWDFIEFKYNHYISLPNFSWTNQSILATSMWTAYSFSWEDNEDFHGINAHRPPPWEGARLGGYNRMRGYENNRFSDKAAFYITAEYRATIKWNPFKHNTYILVPVDWFQIVPFVEAGRVHDNYNGHLLQDMKYDIGISLRAMAAQVPVRLDIAHGDEGTNFWVMVFQPFDF